MNFINRERFRFEFEFDKPSETESKVLDCFQRHFISSIAIKDALSWDDVMQRTGLNSKVLTHDLRHFEQIGLLYHAGKDKSQVSFDDHNTDNWLFGLTPLGIVVAGQLNHPRNDIRSRHAFRSSQIVYKEFTPFS